jgi:hypothetical protein
MLDSILWAEHFHAQIAMLGPGHQLLEHRHHHSVLNALWGHGQVPLDRNCPHVFPAILVHGLTVLEHLLPLNVTHAMLVHGLAVLERLLPPNVTHATLVRGLVFLVLRFHHNAPLVMLVHGRPS